MHVQLLIDECSLCQWCPYGWNVHSDL